MGYQRPTLDEIKTRVASDLASRLPPTASQVRNHLIDILGQILAGSSHSINGAIEFYAQQIFPDTAIDEFLDRQLIYRGVYRRQATISGGVARFTGTTSVPIGLEMKSSAGVRFITISSGNFIDESGNLLPYLDIVIEAMEAGAAGNLPSGTKLSAISPISGVDADAYLEGDTAGGADQESDDSYRARGLEVIQGESSRYGKTGDWSFWAKQTSDVAVDLAFETKNVGNTGLLLISVLSIINDEIVQIPDENPDQVQKVEDYIYTQAPLGVIWDVDSPDLISIELDITISPNTLGYQDLVRQKLANFFLNPVLNYPGKVLSELELEATINTIPGIDVSATDVVIVNQPATMSVYEYQTFGEPTFFSGESSRARRGDRR